MTQPAGQKSGQPNQTKMIMMIMPLVFFFIMYEMPSGLLIYWTMQSLLTFGQMYYINKIKPKKATN
jgi:YidC/Oxa1 family membrane protein insertase